MNGALQKERVCTKSEMDSISYPIFSRILELTFWVTMRKRQLTAPRVYCGFFCLFVCLFGGAMFCIKSGLRL